MIIRRVTFPACEPITVADVATWVRVSLTDPGEIAMVTRNITAIRQQAEHLTCRAFITQTFDLVLDSFPSIIPLRLPPIQSVMSISYLDTDGVLTTMDSTQYVVDTYGEPGRVYPAYGQSWPATQDIPNAVRVRFIAGYGDTAADVPECLKPWILMNVASLYENRENVIVDRNAVKIDLNTLCDVLLHPLQWDVRI